MKKILKWFLLLSKRLYKKPSFLIILALIPICVAAVRLAVTQEGSGFVRIALAQQQAGEGTGAEVIQSLSDESGIVFYMKMDSQEAAVDAVIAGDADEAWIFPADLIGAIREFHAGRRDYVVQIITREEQVALNLAREKIPAAVYEQGAKAYYLDYIRNRLAQLDGVSDEELLTYFDQVQVDEDFFVHGNPADLTGTGEATNYLTSPIRGMLAVLVTLCGMAATLYFMQDMAVGTFSHIKQSRQGLVAFGCIATAVLNVSVVVLLTLFLSSLGGAPIREIGILLLYTVSVAAFCMLMKELLPGSNSFGAVLPLLTVVMLGLCPVFFDFRKLQALQLIFPPTYYINALYDSRYLGYMLAFTASCLLLAYLLNTLKKRLFHAM